MILREPSLAVCDDLKGWNEGRLKRERIYVYLQLVHVVVSRN